MDAIEDLVLIMLHLTLDGENSKKTLPQLIIPTQELASYMRDLLNLNANSLLILHLLNPFEVNNGSGLHSVTLANVTNNTCCTTCIFQFNVQFKKKKKKRFIGASLS